MAMIAALVILLLVVAVLNRWGNATSERRTRRGWRSSGRDIVREITRRL